MVNSKAIAAHFEKNHRDVLRDIDVLRERLSQGGRADLRSLMYQEVRSFDDRANRETRSFDMTKDGFTLLAMGLTLLRALRNAMSAERRKGSAHHQSD